MKEKAYYEQLNITVQELFTTEFKSSYGPVTAYDNEAKANLLNEYFVSCFNTATTPTTRSFLPNVTDDDMTAYDCTPEEAAILLKGIKSHTASGPDEISSLICP